MEFLRKRVSDEKFLRLVKKLIEAPVIENNTITTSNRVERALTSTPSHATVRAMSHTAASVLCLPKAL